MKKILLIVPQLLFIGLVLGQDCTADDDFLTNVYINQYSNAEMELNIINWLSELGFKGEY